MRRGVRLYEPAQNAKAVRPSLLLASGILNISEVAADIVRNPSSGSVVTTSGPPPWKYEGLAFRLFASRAGVHVDFHANRHFDDLWSLPGHFRSPFEQHGNPRTESIDMATHEAAQACICTPTKSRKQILRPSTIAGQRRAAISAKLQCGAARSFQFHRANPAQPNTPRMRLLKSRRAQRLGCSVSGRLSKNHSSLHLVSGRSRPSVSSADT
jgi:hypothetical protein